MNGVYRDEALASTPAEAMADRSAGCRWGSTGHGGQDDEVRVMIFELELASALVR
jgi:hypothetical protein